MASDIRLGGAYVVFRAQDTAFVRRLRNAGNRLDHLRRSVDQVRDSVVRYNRVSRLFTRGFLPLFGAYGILAAARQFQELSDSMLLAQARLRLVSRSTEEAVRAQRRLFQVAQQTRQDFTGLVAIYARFGRSTRQLGLSSDLLLQFVENIAKAVIISGATVKEANAGLIQLSQALAIGVLRGDELRATLEQLPRVMLAVADGLGTTIGALRKLSEAGLLTSGVVIRGLLNQTQALHDEFATIPVTIEGALLRIRNSISRTIDELNKNEGVAQSLVDSINRLRILLEDPAIVRGFTETIASIADAVAFLVQNFSQVAEIGAALIGTLILLSTRFLRTGFAARSFVGAVQFAGLALRSLVSDVSFFYQRSSGQSILDGLIPTLRRVAASSAKFKFQFRESLDSVRKSVRSFNTDFQALWRPFNDVLERSFNQFRNLFTATRQTFRSILRESQRTAQATTTSARDIGTGLSTVFRTDGEVVGRFARTYEQNFNRVNRAITTTALVVRAQTPIIRRFVDGTVQEARTATRALSTIVRSGVPAVQETVTRSIVRLRSLQTGFVSLFQGAGTSAEQFRRALTRISGAVRTFTTFNVAGVRQTQESFSRIIDSTIRTINLTDPAVLALGRISRQINNFFRSFQNFDFREIPRVAQAATRRVVEQGRQLLITSQRMGQALLTTTRNADQLLLTSNRVTGALTTVERGLRPFIHRLRELPNAVNYPLQAFARFSLAVRQGFVPALITARISLGAFIRTLAASTLAVGIAGVITSLQSLAFIFRRLIFTAANARRIFFVLSRVMRFSVATAFGVAATAARVFAFALIRVTAAALGLLRTIARIAISFVVIEGVFQLIRALFELNSVADELGLTFTQLAGVLGVEFIRVLSRVGRAILAFIADIAFTVGQRIQAAFEGTDFQAIGDRVGGLFIRAGASLARALNDSDVNTLADSLLERIDVTPEQRNKVLVNLQRIVKERIEDVKNTFTTGFKDIEDAGRETFDRVNNINLGPGGLGQANAFELVEDLRDRLNSEFIQFERQIQQRRSAVTLNRPQALAENLRLRQEARIQEFLAEQQRALNDLAKQELNIRNEIARVAEDSGIGSLDFAEQERALQQLINARNIGREQVQLIQEQLIAIRQRNSEQQKSILIQAEELIRAEDLKRAADGISRAFGEFASSAIADFKSIGEAARQLAKTILNELLNALAIRPITNFLTPLIGGALGISTAATGGLRSGLTLVGERGAELLDLTSPSRVYSNEQLQEALNAGRTMSRASGVTVNLTQNVQSSDGPGVRAALAESIPLIKDEVMIGVIESVGRPSPMQDALLAG